MDDDLRWSLAHGVRCAFSTIADGDLRIPEARRVWLAQVRGSLRHGVVRQVHGATIVVADAEAPAAEADGQITHDPAVALIAFGADCPGLCIATPDVLAIAHCGWRGTAAGIVERLVEEVARTSRYPLSSFAALIGPGIAAEDYEVDAPVLQARDWPQACLRASRPAHAYLDLPATIAADLARAGLSDIQVGKVCTSSDARLWSYRRQGSGLVQGLAAWRETPTEPTT